MQPRTTPFILLASGSPRRKQLLEEVGFNVHVQATDIDEQSTRTDPTQVVEALAVQKGAAVVRAHPSLAQRAAWTLSADTLVHTKDGRILGKPRDRNDARDMLEYLMGTPHFVTTGFAIFASTDEPVAVEHHTTTVSMQRISAFALEAYLDTDEPWDKAGAYGIQGLAGAFVSRIEGSWHAVVGLPVYDVLRAAQSNGLLVHMPWEKSR